MKDIYPGDRMLDMQQARTAADRYKERSLPEEVVVETQPATEPDNRKKFLKATLTHERARATVTEAESHGARRNAAETLASLAHERIIGSNDMRDINYLELAIA